MSIVVNAAQAGRLHALRLELERSAYRVRLIKVLCGIALGVCFWYSVPYVLPYVVELYPKRAIAMEASEAAGSLSRQIAVPVIGLISLFLLWRLPLRGRFSGHLRYFAAGYVFWSLISVSWSMDPALSAKRLVVFAINVLFAYMVARIFSVTEMALLGVAQTMTVAALGLYGDAVMQHIFSVSNPDYRFQGVTAANYQAMSLVVGILCALTLLDRRPKWGKWLIPLVTFALFLLYITRSRLSTIICLGLLAIMVKRLAKRHLTPATRAMAMLGALAVFLPAMIYFVGREGAGAAQAAFMMGRNDTQNTSNLSNRAPLWAELWGYVEDRPILGTGWDAFWSEARVAKVSADQGWAVPHAHNTYLDQTLSLGVVGAFLYAAMLWGAIRIAWKRYRAHGSATDLLPAVLLTWLALEGVAESLPVDPYLPSILAYACIVKMCLAEGSEAESDIWARPDEVIGGLTPGSLRHVPEHARSEAISLIEEPS